MPTKRGFGQSTVKKNGTTRTTVHFFAEHESSDQRRDSIKFGFVQQHFYTYVTAKKNKLRLKNNKPEIYLLGAQIIENTSEEFWITVNKLLKNDCYSK
jgi:hypothetical protein